jgi:hypothetical protein
MGFMDGAMAGKMIRDNWDKRKDDKQVESALATMEKDTNTTRPEEIKPTNWNEAQKQAMGAAKEKMQFSEEQLRSAAKKAAYKSMETMRRLHLTDWDPAEVAKIYNADIVDGQYVEAIGGKDGSISFMPGDLDKDGNFTPRQGARPTVQFQSKDHMKAAVVNALDGGRIFMEQEIQNIKTKAKKEVSTHDTAMKGKLMDKGHGHRKDEADQAHGHRMEEINAQGRNAAAVAGIKSGNGPGGFKINEYSKRLDTLLRGSFSSKKGLALFNADGPTAAGEEALQKAREFIDEHGNKPPAQLSFTQKRKLKEATDAWAYWEKVKDKILGRDRDKVANGDNRAKTVSWKDF